MDSIVNFNLHNTMNGANDEETKIFMLSVQPSKTSRKKKNDHLNDITNINQNNSRRRRTEEHSFNTDQENLYVSMEHDGFDSDQLPTKEKKFLKKNIKLTSNSNDNKNKKVYKKVRVPHSVFP